MRVLLADYDWASVSPPAAVAFFLLQLVRQTAVAGHELRRLVPNATDAGKDFEAGRREWRRRLDREVREFDPQIVHVQGIGMIGHLVLESGLPYLLSTWGHEVPECQRDGRLYDLARQVLENAGRVLVDGQATRRAVEAAFGEPERPIVCLADRGWPAISALPAEKVAPSLDWLWGIYREIVDRRAGIFQGE
ncbi:MAG TPA: glycosyltransferase [Pirellulales bacterium]|nr:glycosyltransferase [Pirellulales bacterium]